VQLRKPSRLVTLCLLLSVQAPRLMDVSVPAGCTPSTPSRTHPCGGTTGPSGAGPGGGNGGGGPGAGPSHAMQVPLPLSLPLQLCCPERRLKLRLTALALISAVAVYQLSLNCGGGYDEQPPVFPPSVHSTPNPLAAGCTCTRVGWLVPPPSGVPPSPTECQPPVRFVASTGSALGSTSPRPMQWQVSTSALNVQS
jgi:hypothetical protein